MFLALDQSRTESKIQLKCFCTGATGIFHIFITHQILLGKAKIDEMSDFKLYVNSV